MVTYDITSSTSFASVKTWMKEVRDHTSQDIVLMMVGNKMDLRHLRVVNEEEGESFAAENDMLFIETSALDSTNVEDAFHEVIRKAHRKMQLKRKIEERREEAKTETIQLEQIKDIPKNTKSNACCLT